jgi:hypothetical protein
MAPMWRTSDDIVFWGNAPSMTNILGNFDKAQHPAAQHTGYANDPDMLTVGMTGMTAAQNRTHMGLWAISGAPLLAGNNLATMTTATAAILKNPEVLAVDQDSLGLQGVKVSEDSSGLQVYSKVLSGTGRRAALLLNRTSSAATMNVRWVDLGLTGTTAAVRNLWSAANVGSFSTGYSVNVPANDSVLLTVTGTDTAATTYEAESSVNTRAGAAAPVSCASCSGGSLVSNIGNGTANTLRFNDIAAAASGFAVATIAYVNGDTTARTATLQVGAATPTVVAFPPTGSWSTAGTVSVLVSLTKGSTNTLAFSNATGWAPDLDGVDIRALPGTNGNQIIGVQSGRCVDVDNNSISNGLQAQLWNCTSGTNQTWTYTAGKQLVVYGNKCLDANNNGTTNGTVVEIWDCNGQTNQQWNINANGTISGVQSGLCVDATGNGTADGTKIILWTCGSGTNQKWTLN